MERVERNELASHESLSENIDDVVDDLFSELAEQIETTDEISAAFGESEESAENELTFSSEIGWSGEGAQPGAEEYADQEVNRYIIPEEFIGVVRTNIKAMAHSAARLTQLERLFTEVPGYGKLYGAMRNLRETTEHQMDSLTRALAKDYRKLPGPPIMPIRRWKMRKKTANASACPWNVLTVAKWKDTMVAFVPEQIAYLSKTPIIQNKKNNIQFDFPLKKLKKWPWDKLGPLFSGKLSETSEKELAQLRLPIVPHPGIFQTLNEQKEHCYLLILCHEDHIGAVFLDSMTEDIYVPSRWAWSRETQEDTVLAGHIKVYGKYLPVINIAKQASLFINAK